MNRHIPQLDWRAYFQRFSELHGGCPLQKGGWLWFPDGWRCSATSHRGPERAPESPAEERQLMTVYWKMRLASVSKERRELHTSLVGLEQAQRVFSAPLQQRIWHEQPAKNEFGDDIVRKVPGACDLDLEGLRSRIRELDEDIEQCNRVLEELKEKQPESGYGLGFVAEPKR